MRDLVNVHDDGKKEMSRDNKQSIKLIMMTDVNRLSTEENINKSEQKKKDMSM